MSRREIVVLLDKFRDFLKAHKQASKSIPILLPRPTIEIGSTLSEDNLFAHFYKEFREHSNSQLALSVRFEPNNKCLFSINKFDIHGDQPILAKIVNINHHQIYSHYKNRYLFGYKCGFCESN